METETTITPTKGVAKLIPKRLRRRLEPSAGIHRHRTFAADEAAIFNPSDDEQEHRAAMPTEDEESSLGSYESDPELLSSPRAAAVAAAAAAPAQYQPQPQSSVSSNWRVGSGGSGSGGGSGTGRRPPAISLDSAAVQSAAQPPLPPPPIPSPHFSSRADPTDADADRPARSRVPRQQQPQLQQQLAVSQPHQARSPSPAARIRDIFSSRKSNPTLGLTVATRIATDPDTGSPLKRAETTVSKSTESASPERARARSRRARSRSRSIVASVRRPETPPPQSSVSFDTSPPPAIVNTPPTPTYGSGAQTRRHQRQIQEEDEDDDEKKEAAPEAEGDQPDITAASSPHRSNGSPPVKLSSLRRVRTGSTSIGPSKLSTTSLPPTSSDNEGRPFTSAAALPSTSSFFSSMFSAAQSAATSLISAGNNSSSNNISNNNNNNNDDSGSAKSKSGTLTASTQGLGIREPGPDPAGTPQRPAMDVKKDPPAINTIGAGELSLSQLGLSDPAETERGGGAAGFLPPSASDGRARPDTGDPSAGLSGNDPWPEEAANGASRPRSMGDLAGFGPGADLSSPTGSVYEDRASTRISRSGSVKSAFRRNRERGGSNTTAGTSASAATVGGGAPPLTTGSGTYSAAAAANGSGPPPPTPSGPKLTGFAVANKKRNKDFHTLFKSVPDDDYLIEDYSCALQREILAHGRLYVSEGHLCFSSNILGWVTTLVMSFGEIVSVEKRSTALVFKNGLMITTLHAKHIFASFTSRDATYDLIVNIWKLGHPSLQSTLNGVRLEGTGGDRTEKIDHQHQNQNQNQNQPLPTPSSALVLEQEDRAGSGSDEYEDEEGEEDEGDDDEVYDEDEDGHLIDTTQVTDQSVLSELHEADKSAVSRKTSAGAAVTAAAAAAATAITAAANGAVSDPTKEPFPAVPGGGSGNPNTSPDFPGPVTHPPTDCGDATTHYDRTIGDDVIPAPLGRVYSLLFGPESATWLPRWLTNDQKCTELLMEDRKGLGPENKTRTYQFIKPLNSSIGPRQTKCIITEVLEGFDLDRAVNISCSTITPDVPSGNVFSTRTKYCLSWADNNSTRIQANCTIEWTGKSWLKGPIEKGANDGQTQYCKEVFASLKAAVSRPRSGTASNGGVKAAGGRPRRKVGGRKAPQSPTDGPGGPGSGDLAHGSGRSSSKRRSWGLLEPVRPLLEPVVDIGKPLATGNVMYGVLVGLLVASWFGFGFTNRSAPATYGDVGASAGIGRLAPAASFPDRIAAYEEMWHREESDLWEWLEERVGLDRMGGIGGAGGAGGVGGGEGPRDTGGAGSESGGRGKRHRAGEARTLADRLRGEKMEDSEVEDAIRVTEDRLRVLKDMMARKRERPQTTADQSR